MPVFSDFTFKSSTGINKIHVKKCLTDSTPRAVVQIAHGIAEHCGRYTDFMRFLAENGFAVYADDHLGHGKSVLIGSEKGFFAEKDGWKHVVSDLALLHDIAAAENPGIPYVMFGHSMGSFLTRNYMIDHPDKYDYAILSGTGHQDALTVLGGNIIAEALVLKNGPYSSGKMLDDIAFGSYLDKIEKPRTKFDWLSRDKKEVDKYIADPMCGFVCTASLYRDMMNGLKYITSKSNIAKMDKSKPVYFMSGDADPVGDYGKGVERAYKAFCDAGLHDVMIRLYPGGRHEMLNETNRDAVYNDILEWLNDRMPETEGTI